MMQAPCTFDHFFEPLPLDRLQQIGDSVSFECGQGMFMEAGDKDDQGQFQIGGKRLEDFEIIQTRHLHVQEHQIRTQFLDSR